MRAVTILIPLLLCFDSRAARPQWPPDWSENLTLNPTIRVLLTPSIPYAEIATTLDPIYVSTEGTHHSVRIGRNLNVGWNKNSQGEIFLTLNGVPSRLKNLSIRSATNTGHLRFGSEIHRGILETHATAKGLMVILITRLEDYLVGTVGAEMPPTWEHEVLKAQATAARSYALYMKRNPKHHKYDVERNAHDQMYSGLDSGSERLRKAVAETAGQFLVWNGKPIKAFFHSRCGGNTESAGIVWNEQSAEPLKKTVACPYCRHHPFRWKTSVELPRLARILGVSTVPTNFSPTLSTIKSPSGRVAQLRLGLGDGMRSIDSDVLRQALGYHTLKSTMFDWGLDGTTVHFYGIGLGHGVGMCQWGARHLAREGYDHRAILKHYYPGASLSSLQIHAKSP